MLKAEAAPCPLLSQAQRWGALIATIIAYGLACFAPYDWTGPASYTLNDAQLIHHDGKPWLRVNGAGLAELVLPDARPDWSQSPQRLQLSLSLMCSREQQFGPARIVTLSRDTLERNLMLGQDGTALVLRLLRPGSNSNGVPELRVEEFFGVCRPRQLGLLLEAGALTLSSDGEVILALPAPLASMDRWSAAFPIFLGNEGTWDRGWAGEVADLLLEVDGQTLVSGLQAAKVPPGAWLLSRRAQSTHRFTLVPFSKDVFDGWKDITLNVLGFLPFGGLLALGWVRLLNLAHVALLAAAFSASIELGQIGFEGRFPSVTDVVTNTLGGVLGFLVGRVWLRRYRRNRA